MDMLRRVNVGRQRLYTTNAERQAAYRERHARDLLRQIPMVQGEGYTLYQGDAWQILSTLAGVDAILTDPPFAAQTHAGARGGGMRQTTLIPFAPFTDAAAVRLVKLACGVANRWVILSMDWRHAATVEKHCPTLFVRAGVWTKPNGAPQFTGDRPGTGWEGVTICHRPGRKTWNGGGQHAVWDVPRSPSTHHPTEKPLALLRAWVRLFSDPGEVVCDPFMGSGTTGVACLEEGRRFVGIEQDPAYFQTACQRLAQASAQGRLFAVPRLLHQEPLFSA
jgi:site-specific DNA-methyltransferase (adenine-specific)